MAPAETAAVHAFRSDTTCRAAPSPRLIRVAELTQKCPSAVDTAPARN
jgi:hypothetical protein